jgi:hypothetical protein
MDKAASMRMADTKEDIELIRDPEKKRAEYEKLLRSVSQEMIGVEQRIKAGTKEVEGWDAAWQITGDRKGFAEQAKARLAEDKERIGALKDEMLELQRMLSERALANEELKKQNALQDKSDAYIQGLRDEVALLETKGDLLAKAKLSTADDASAVAAAELLKRVELLKLEDEQLKKQHELQKQSGEYIKSLEKELALINSRNSVCEVAKQSTTGDADTKRATELLQQIELAKAQAESVKQSEAYLVGLRKEVELLRAKKDEQAGIAAKQNTFGNAAQAEAEQLIKERDAIKAKEELDKKAADEAKRLADQKLNDAKQIEQLRQKELDKLEEERIALTQGKEAAHAFNLEKQGLSKTDAARIAKEQSAIDLMKKANEPAKETQVVTLQAQETRLLTMGDTQDFASQQLQITQDTNAKISAMATTVAPALPALVAAIPVFNTMAGLLGGILTATNKETETI